MNVIAEHFKRTVLNYAIGIILGLLLAFSINDTKQWGKFSKDHHCEVIKAEGGGTSGMTWMPSKTVYRCDDSMTHYR